MSTHTNLFTQVNHTRDPDRFVRFLDEGPAIQTSKRLMLERLTVWLVVSMLGRRVEPDNCSV
ncbi:MAG: hypothetical protein J2P36_22305 [Ktedonobacteraceae bacterium]|nr:hypothetical protein [Ktedonobacteraceae bacterium]